MMHGQKNIRLQRIKFGVCFQESEKWI